MFIFSFASTQYSISHYFNKVSKHNPPYSLFQHDIKATFLWPSTSSCFLTFRLTILVLKSTATQLPKFYASSTSHASHAGQVWCANLITTQMGLFSFYVLAFVGPSPLSGLFEVWLIISHSPLSALFLNFGPSSAPFEVWLIVGPFLDFALSSTRFEVWFIVSLDLSSAPFEFWPFVLNLYSLAT